MDHLLNDRVFTLLLVIEQLREQLCAESCACGVYPTAPPPNCLNLPKIRQYNVAAGESLKEVRRGCDGEMLMRTLRLGWILDYFTIFYLLTLTNKLDRRF